MGQTYKVCSACQNAAPLDTDTCVRCGHRFVEPRTDPKPAPKKVVPGFLFVLLFVVLAGLFCRFGTVQHSQPVHAEGRSDTVPATSDAHIPSGKKLALNRPIVEASNQAIALRTLVKRDRQVLAIPAYASTFRREHRHELRALRLFERRLRALRLPGDVCVLAVRPGQRFYTIRLVLPNETRVLNNPESNGEVPRIRLTDALNHCWNVCWEAAGNARENDEANGDPEPSLRFYCEDGSPVSPDVFPDLPG